MGRVVELGGYAAGYCGRLFAHTGHEVVRIDNGRRDPAWVSDLAMDTFLHFGKKTIQTSNQELIKELIHSADVAILDVDSADVANNWNFHQWEIPVKVAITPFGLTGPKRNCPATSSTLLALGGFTFLMGDEEREPLTLPGHFVEFQTGCYAFAAVQACRLKPESNVIDIGKLEVVMSLSQFTTVMWHCADILRSRHGNDFWWVVPTNMFRCKDGWVYMNIVPGFWDPFCTFLDLPELVLEERFRTNKGRMQHRDEIHVITAGVLKNMTRDQIQKRAVKCRIPLGAVLTFDEILEDPHLQQRDRWSEQSVKETTVKLPRLPWVVHNDENAISTTRT